LSKSNILSGKFGESISHVIPINNKIPEDKRVTFSCGSGITACILALGAELAGRKDLSVYDGSWTEWGSIVGVPIER